MNREQIQKLMYGSGQKDYELYLNTPKLLRCQKEFSDLVNEDELQFQIVHQVEELWMKLIGYTLLDIHDQIEKKKTNKVLTLFSRVHKLLGMMTEQLSLLETMSPFDYQKGSGQESPGFQVLLHTYEPLYAAFEQHYLKAAGLTVEMIYNSRYSHCDAYMVAEALAEYDELFQKFRFHHIQLIHRSIGLGAKSLKGRSVSMLDEGLRKTFFPALWEIRNQMTDSWGASYGVKREPISKTQK
jgi:tryptophan 2,3-dioxygenase